MKQRNVTLKDVARHAGVSAMTVSRALSGKSNLVTPDTLERCQAAARELGYVPNLMARSLRGEQLRTIVLFAEFISSHHYLAELVDFTSRSIESRGYGVICCQSLTSFHHSLRQFNLGGAVVIAPPETFYDDPFGETRIGPLTPPHTVLIHSAIEQSRFSEISPDIVDLSYRAARHLLDLGHRKIAYIGGPDSSDEPRWFKLRRQGLTRAMTERGIDPAMLLHQPCANSDMGPGAVTQLLARAPGTTAILCISDEVAISVVAGLQALGHQVPRDVSVVGCNNIDLSKFVTPSLTTVAIDVAAMVERGLQLLFDEDGETTGDAPVRIRIPASLIVRDSSAPPPAPDRMGAARQKSA